MGALIGIDVSAYQGIIDWQKAKQAGCAFAFIRCHYQGGKDKYFDRNWAETKKAGTPRGAYGWVIPGKDQKAEADKFCGYLGDDLGELAPAVDFEKYNGTPTFGELRTFIERVEVLTKRLPYIYTSYGFWTSQAGYANQTWAARYPLWHAQYTNAVTPTIKAPFNNWTFWQYSSPGNRQAANYGTGGFDLDINRFNGDIVDFEKLIGTEVIEPEPNDLKVRVAKLEGRLDILTDWARSIGYKG
jgi:lysozyme